MWAFVRACCVQMMYHPNGGGAALRRPLGWLLGLWHPVKQAALLVFRVYGYTFLAPAFHNAHPRMRYPDDKARVSFAMSTMVRMMVAYGMEGGIREEMMKLMAVRNEEVDFDMRPHLVNLKDLFEYVIPTVRCVSVDIL